MLTKKDYELIAKVIKDCTEWEKFNDGYGVEFQEKGIDPSKIILTLIKENFGTLVENLFLKNGKNWNKSKNNFLSLLPILMSGVGIEFVVFKNFRPI